MAHGFAICRMAGGLPDIDFEATPVHGYTLGGVVGNFGAYLFSGTGAQLTTLNALPQIVGICVMTTTGDVRWAELDGKTATAIRNKLNTWLTTRGYPTIPITWTYRQVVKAIYQRMNNKFDLGGIDVADGGT